MNIPEDFKTFQEWYGQGPYKFYDKEQWKIVQEQKQKLRDKMKNLNVVKPIATVEEAVEFAQSIPLWKKLGCTNETDGQKFLR